MCLGVCGFIKGSRSSGETSSAKTPAGLNPPSFRFSVLVCHSLSLFLCPTAFERLSIRCLSPAHPVRLLRSSVPPLCLFPFCPLVRSASRFIFLLPDYCVPLFKKVNIPLCFIVCPPLTPFFVKNVLSCVMYSNVISHLNSSKIKNTSIHFMQSSLSTLPYFCTTDRFSIFT